jgi:predicted PurR-regulated permease PerM
VVAVYFAGQLLFRLRSALLVMVLAGFVALLLNPFVRFLQRHGFKRRGSAVAIVALLLVALFAGLSFAFGYPLVNGLTHLANGLPKYVKDAQSGRGLIGHLIRRYHVEHWFSTNSSKLVSLAKGLSKPALAIGKGAVSATLTLLTMFFFIVLFLLEGPKLRTGIMAITPQHHKERVEHLGSAISRAALGYMLGGLLTSVIGAIVMFITLTLLGVPFALLFSLWVLLVDFLPQIGGALAGAPTIVFALVYSPHAGVITAIVFVAYTLIQNHVLNPIVMAKTVNINPLLVFTSIIIGAEIGSWVGGLFGGFVGVLLAVPLAATVHVVVKDLWEATHPANNK